MTDLNKTQKTYLQEIIHKAQKWLNTQHKKKDQKTDTKLRKKILKTLTQLQKDVFDINQPNGQPETIQTLNTYTTEELIQILQEALNELQKIT